MTNKEPVTLSAFKDYIDLHVDEGVEQATVAATAFATGLHPDEFREAIQYAAEQNIELVFIPDVNEYEPDYNPQDENRTDAMKEARLQKMGDLFSNPLGNV